MLADLRLKMLFPGSRYNSGAHLATSSFAATLKNAHYCGFVFAAGPGDFGLSFRGVHEARLTSNESFVRLDLAGEFVKRSVVEGEADAVHHMPRRFLGDAKVAPNFVATDSVLAISEKPYGSKPFIQTKGGILEDGAGF